MKLTDQDLNKICTLARIKMNNETEKENLKNSIEKVLCFTEMLSEVNTEQTENFYHESVSQMRLYEDLVTEKEMPEVITKNAPKAFYNMFAVPKMIE